VQVNDTLRKRAKVVNGSVGSITDDPSCRSGAASLAQLGQLDEARAEVELFLVGNPHFTTSHWATTEPFRDDQTLQHSLTATARPGAGVTGQTAIKRS
jgi:hypothetical protein